MFHGKAVYAFFFFKCIRFVVEGRTPTFAYNCIPGETRDTWLICALRDNKSVHAVHVAEVRERFIQQFIKANKRNNAENKNDLTDHPLVQ